MTRALRALLVLGLFLPASAAAGPVTSVPGAPGRGRRAMTASAHRRTIRLPVYALQTDLSGGRVLRGARRLIAGSRIPARRAKLVDASRENSHLDPLTATPARSRFPRTIVPFLRRTAR